MVKKKSYKLSDSSKHNFSEAITLNPELREQVAQKAYELYEKRGGGHGHDIEDWFEAECLAIAKQQNDTNP